MIISIIAALARNRVIGRNGRLPWHLPDDLAFFKQTTMGKPLLMGRRTWESIGRLLPDRPMIVLSRDTEYSAKGCIVVPDWSIALIAASTSHEIMVIGGTELYAQALHRADRLYLTRIDADFEGDAWFPEWNETDWRLEWEEAHPTDERHAWPYRFQRWKSIRPEWRLRPPKDRH